MPIDSPLAPFAWVARGVRTGNAHLPGRSPAYVPLDPAAKAAAMQRGAGRQVVQGLTGDVQGAPGNSDPVNLVVTGSLDALVKGLQARGWVTAGKRSAWNFTKIGVAVLFGLGEATDGPVSTQYLNGKVATTALCKNSDHGRARDHLRIYPMAPDPGSGRPRWAIAATRDTAVSLDIHDRHVEIGHDIDGHIDPERDMVMHDLLASGAVSSFAAVPGLRMPGLDAPGPDGFHVAGRFDTDGKLYLVDLNQ